MKSLFLFLLVIVNIQLNAQDSFIIKDVKLFDGNKVTEKTSVKVIGDKIVKISPTIKSDHSIIIINGLGKTLMPALSNAHVHAWSPMSLKQAASSGVLNVMDMHGVENFQLSMRRLKDSTNYARYYVAGYAATAPGGHGTQFGFEVPTIKSEDDVSSFIAERVKSKVDYVKIIVEPYKVTLSHEIVAEIIDQAHEKELQAVVHISRLDDALKVLENDADALVHIWWDKAIDPLKLNTLAYEKNFFIIPTLLTTLKAFESMGENSEKFLSKDELLAEVKNLHNANVPILAGTDPPNLGINYGSDLYKELYLFSEAGLSNVEVLKTATSNVAKAFNLEHTGLIEQGFLADMLLIDGDPTENLEDISKIQKVWKAGKLIE